MASVVPEADLWGCSLRVSLAPFPAVHRFVRERVRYVAIGVCCEVTTRRGAHMSRTPEGALANQQQVIELRRQLAEIQGRLGEALAERDEAIGQQNAAAE